jgi:hypothetical protein
MYKKIGLVLCILFSSFAMSWTPSGERSKVVKMIQWNGNADVVVKLESGIFCYIPANETMMISFALSLYMSQKKADWHCYDAAVSKGGYMSHKVHRVIGN